MTSFTDRPDPDSSIELLTRAKTGDQLAIELLCSRYLKRLQAWAHGRLPAFARAHADTQDVAQETLIQVMRHLDTFQPRHAGAFQGFVFRAMIHRVVDEIRRASRQPSGPPLGAHVPSSEPSPWDLTVEARTRASYEAALLKLREGDRAAIVAKIELELPWTEVAEALEKPTVAAARMAVSRALVRLAREMAHEQGQH